MVFAILAFMVKGKSRSTFFGAFLRILSVRLGILAIKSGKL